MTGKVLVFANEKGGVGKTTCSVQVAYELASKQTKVCIIDNDPSGDATTALYGHHVPDSIKLGNKPEALANTLKLYSADADFAPVEVVENLHLMGATDALSVLKGADMEPAYEFCDSVDMLREQFDYVIIDCPPSFGLLFTSAILASASGGILIPTIPDELSFKAALKVKNRVDQMNERMRTGLTILGLIANKVVNNPMPQSVRFYLDKMATEFGSLNFETQINNTIKISDAISLQIPIRDYAKSDSKPALQITALTEEIINRLRP